MKDIYIYPPYPPLDREMIRNPYVENLSEGLLHYFNVLTYRRFVEVSIIDLCKSVFKMDIILFNWIEDLGYRNKGGAQFLVFILTFIVMKIRRVKIIWFYHNIHPHLGESFISKLIKRILFKYSDLIIVHSTLAYDYCDKRTKSKLVNLIHPNSDINTRNLLHKKSNYDIFIWGTIEPYKGIVPFLEFLKDKEIMYKIKVIGSCSNKEYFNKLKSYETNLISIENRCPSFEEIEDYINMSDFIVFPYISNAFSSSGALFDTLAFKGNVIGPNKGVFSDLSKMDLCFVFDTYEDIITHIHNKKIIDNNLIMEFVNTNTWEGFCKSVYGNIIHLYRC
ncbi:hypothetical protein [Flavicella sp.]|uniref:hypothetical protein n=1 Tax=Flavicella sp. TaxID=2957742 RepID=UPI003018D974